MARFRSCVRAGEKIGTVVVADVLDRSRSVAGRLTSTEAPSLFGLLVLDIETTGNVASVIGLGSFDENGGLIVDQLVLGARDDEGDLLADLLARVATATMLVTYNGRSFDLRVLRSRCLLNGLLPDPLEALPHIDLLVPARMLWRDRAGDCRLVTLEENVLGRQRPDEDSVVEHNRNDVCGTAALLVAVLRVLEDPLLWAEDGGELLGAAEHFDQAEGAGAALPLVTRALELARDRRTRRRALLFLASLQRRLAATGTGRSTPAAHTTWQRYRAEFPRENRGHVEVAKHLEHRERDLDGALAAALAAPHGGLEEVQKRVIRLRRRRAGQSSVGNV